MPPPFRLLMNLKNRINDSFANLLQLNASFSFNGVSVAFTMIKRVRSR